MADSQDPTAPAPLDIQPIALEEEMKRSYLDYAMSVIVSRALPDVRDGLKPVHRRILFAMQRGGYDSSKPYRKSARIIGDVMGQYHPHGDAAIYDAMVRMAQPFSMRLPLIDGQGNFGSLDDDPPAAMRYTEARLAKVAETLLEDIDKETVDWQPNYDESIEEPVVLPAGFPNLLVNGAGGIAVGMATNIPPHNLGEVIDACFAYLDNPGITAEELIEIVPGPDFPTGGQIIGRAGILSAYTTGNGSIMMRAKTHKEAAGKDREAIIVTEIPYQLSKEKLVKRIAEVANEKIVEGIAELRDESDRDGVRVVIELRRDADYDVVLNQLFRFTPLQNSFGANILALNAGRPETLTLKQIIAAFLEFREEVITKRTRFELRKARERAHVLVGLAVAVANIDDVIALIRAAGDPAEARAQLMDRAWPAADVAPLIALIEEVGREGLAEDNTYRLSEAQARAILDLRLHRLTGLERDKIGDDLRAIVDTIKDLLEILSNRSRLLEVLRAEMQAIRDQYATPRRTEIIDAEFEHDIEALIAREDMVVTVSATGYIKRVPLSTYRAQKRGGKGRTGMSMKEEDIVSSLFIANTHTPILFFTTRGIVYKLKVYRLPQGTPQARGKALVNILPLEAGETVSAVMPMPEDEDSWGEWDIMFATSRGTVRRNSLSDFANIRSNGLIAMKLEEGDRLIAVKTGNEDDDILLATRNGRCIRFPVTEIRRFAGRTSMGVRGIRLLGDDEVLGMSILRHIEVSQEEREAYLKAESSEADLPAARQAELAEGEEFLLTVAEKGFGKRTSAYDFRVTGRGGQGITSMVVNDRNGRVAGVFPVTSDDEIMLITDNGRVMRMPVDDVRTARRQTQGVTLFRINNGESVVSVAAVPIDREEEGEDDGDAGGETPDTDETGPS